MGKGLFGSMRGGFPVYFEPWATSQQEQYRQSDNAGAPKLKEEKLDLPKAISGHYTGLADNQIAIETAESDVNSMLSQGIQKYHTMDRFIKTPEFAYIMQKKNDIAVAKVYQGYIGKATENYQTEYNATFDKTKANNALGTLYQPQAGVFSVIDVKNKTQRLVRAEDLNNPDYVPMTWQQHYESVEKYTPLYNKGSKSPMDVNMPSLETGSKLYDENGIPLYEQKFRTDLDALQTLNYSTGKEEILDPALLKNLGIDPKSGILDLLKKTSVQHITNATQYSKLAQSIEYDLANYLSPEMRKSAYQDYATTGIYMKMPEITKDKEGNEVVTYRTPTFGEYILDRFQSMARQRKIDVDAPTTGFIKGPTSGEGGPAGRGPNYIATALEAPNVGLQPVNSRETTTYFTGAADLTKANNGQVPYTMAVAPSLTYTMPQMNKELSYTFGMGGNVQNADGTYSKELKTAPLSSLPGETVVLTAGNRFSAALKLSDLGPDARIVSWGNKIIAGAIGSLDDQGDATIKTDGKGNIEWGQPYVEALVSVTEDYIEKAKIKGIGGKDFYLASRDAKLKSGPQLVENERALTEVFGNTGTYTSHDLSKKKESGLFRVASSKGGSHAVRLIKIRIPVDPMFAAQGGQGSSVPNLQLLNRINEATQKFTETNRNAWQQGNTNYSNINQYLGNNAPTAQGMSLGVGSQFPDPLRMKGMSDQKLIDEIYTQQALNEENTDIHVIK